MKVISITKQLQIQHTTASPTNYIYTLEAIGFRHEVEWIAKVIQDALDNGRHRESV